MGVRGYSLLSLGIAFVSYILSPILVPLEVLFNIYGTFQEFVAPVNNPNLQTPKTFFITQLLVIIVTISLSVILLKITEKTNKRIHSDTATAPPDNA